MKNRTIILKEKKIELVRNKKSNGCLEGVLLNNELCYNNKYGIDPLCRIFKDSKDKHFELWEK
jgi:hypothetical protein